MILLIDNYDSFSYNLYQAMGALGAELRVVRSDALTVEEVAALDISHIVLSPGPGAPADAGICVEVARRLGHRVPILGVCLGHQAICEAFGGVVGRAARLMHGKASRIRLNVASPLFAGLPEEVDAARYHSLAAEEAALPDVLEVTARTVDGGDIMAVRHRALPVFGVQFHPESILTPRGNHMLANFLTT